MASMGDNGGSNHSQIMCGGCHVLLMYPQGASNVRCARCQHITAVPVLAPPPGPDFAKVACSNLHCRVVLMYPRGAPQVQCSLCGTITNAQQANSVGHIVCEYCRVTLMYQYGAQSVKCSLCHHVTQIGQSTLPSAGAGPSSGGGVPPPAQQPATVQQPESVKPAVQTVVVENPPTLDDTGQEVQSIVVGVTTKNIAESKAAAS